jgi:hypothetical protein
MISWLTAQVPADVGWPAVLDSAALRERDADGLEARIRSERASSAASS